MKWYLRVRNIISLMRRPVAARSRIKDKEHTAGEVEDTAKLESEDIQPGAEDCREAMVVQQCHMSNGI